jgi:hypothetical protein
MNFTDINKNDSKLHCSYAIKNYLLIELLKFILPITVPLINTVVCIIII